jgi:hypothetical protein
MPSYDGPDRRNRVDPHYHGPDRRDSHPLLSDEDVVWIKKRRAREEAMDEIAKYGATALRLIVLIAAAAVAWEQLKPTIRGMVQWVLG